MSASTPPDETRLRLRALVDAQFAVLLAVCLLVAAVGSGLVYATYVDPGTETETRTVSSLTVETGYVHAAEVIEPNPVFETGTVLSDRNTYFTRIAPVLDVAVEAQYSAASAGDVGVSFESVLVIRNVGEEGETVYWEDREPLASETVSGVTPDATAAVSFAINSSEVAATAAAIEEELGTSPGTTEAVVVTDVTVTGTINGEPTTVERTIRMTIEPGTDTYTISEPGIQSTTTEETEQVTVQREYGPLRSIGGPVLFLLGAAGVGGLVYARRRRDLALTSAEREYLSYRDDRSEFDEWITTFRLPDAAHDRPEAVAESLADLVDFAIDSDSGVVEDPTTGAFHVAVDEFIYTYRPPPPADEPGVGDEVHPSDADSDVDDGDVTTAVGSGGSSAGTGGSGEPGRAE